ncbi:hypothetical protein [Chitinimonas koreensis]|uniref:hypothetical protein n=1 Tax=Chitinimonas koreensis TaxID=356302 RepID=UPI00048BA3B1|nr:hypothetical protein [Chitinimonas koreensis]QNM94878.1 hypothetical protein H9L41_13195 [Chitinimonas koreensis]
MYLGQNPAYASNLRLQHAAVDAAADALIVALNLSPLPAIDLDAGLRQLLGDAPETAEQLTRRKQAHVRDALEARYKAARADRVADDTYVQGATTAEMSPEARIEAENTRLPAQYHNLVNWVRYAYGDLIAMVVFA